MSNKEEGAKAPFWEHGLPTGVGTEPIAKHQPWRDILAQAQAAKSTSASEKWSYSSTKTAPWLPEEVQPSTDANPDDRVGTPDESKEPEKVLRDIRLLNELDAKSRK
jgi:hypothetical protein